MDFSFLDEQSNEGIKKYINFLDNNIDRINEIAFYLASKGNLEIIEYLISQKKIDINVKRGKQILFNACASGNIELVKCLLDHGANVNAKDKKGKTALFYACQCRNTELIKYLVGHGAEKKEALKISIEQDYYNLFKKILNGNKNLLEELRKEENNEWKQMLQNRLDNWLEERCKGKKNYDINLLLSCITNHKIFYNKIEKLIINNDFKNFKDLILELKTELKQIRIFISKKEQLQIQLRNWLNSTRVIEDIQLLKAVGAGIVYGNMKKIEIERIERKNSLYNHDNNPWEDTNPH